MTESYQRELIIDHYKHPRRKGLLDAPQARHHDRNPFCGDEITVDLMVEDGVVVEARFDGRGCSISQAAASILMEDVIGRTPDELAALDDAHMLALLGIEIGPVRMKCARLPLGVLQGALQELNQNNATDIDNGKDSE